MKKYFVVFRTESDDAIPENDVVEYSKEISDIEDIKNIETMLANSWYGDDRRIVLVNYKAI